MSWILAVAVGTCMIIVAGGAVIAFWLWLEARTDRSPDKPHRDLELEARLADIEHRLTDTQDIVLSLNEKFERLEPFVASPERGGLS